MSSLAYHTARIEADAALVQSPSQFARCAPAFDALVRDHECIAEVFNRTLDLMLSKSGYSPRDLGVQWRSDGVKLASQVSLESRKSFTLIASVQHAASRSAFSAPGSVHIAVLSDAPLPYRLYALPADYNNEVFDEIELELLGRYELEPLQSLFLDGSRHVLVFQDTEALVLKLQSSITYPFEWAFDLDTLRAWQMTSTILEDTQLVHVCEALAAMGFGSDAAALEPVLACDRHHVRWAAMQAIASLDGSRARRHLQESLADAHPHIRAAARAGMERFRECGAE